MEDVYTIKVKTKPDTRNLYPSERRYSASTVNGLAWVHIALGATCLLLASLAFVNPNSNINSHDFKNTEQSFDNNSISKSLEINETSSAFEKNDDAPILILAPFFITVCALGAGIASIMASMKWYIDRNITWLFIVSCISTLVSMTAFVMVMVWVTNISDGKISEFYKDKVPFADLIVLKNSDVIDRNQSHIIIKNSNSIGNESDSRLFTKRVLSINILIAAFLETLWSMLSVKIAFKGMRSIYREDNERRTGNCVSVVTKIKGNNTKNLPRNKLLPPKPDLINHYPNEKLKTMFFSQTDDVYYFKSQNNKIKQNTDTSSEFCKERMINFLNRCASMELISNYETQFPSVQSVHFDSETALNPFPYIGNLEANDRERPADVREQLTPVSWGDTPEHTVYNQNTLNLEKIFHFATKKNDNNGEIVPRKLFPHED